MALWKILLAVWMIVWGLLAISNFKFEGQNLVMGCLAIATGILIFVDKRAAA